MSRYTVIVRRIDIVGKGWYNQQMAMSLNLSAYDVENIGELTRENIQLWLDSHAGDFQSILDFRADIDEFESDFETEEGECIFNDCMFGDEE